MNNNNEYFEYNGNKYFAGTKFHMIKEKFGVAEIVDAVFRGYANKDSSILFVQYKFKVDNCIYGVMIQRENMQSVVIDIVEGNYYTELEAHKKYPNDFDVLDIIIGWVAYVIVMTVLVIFHYRIIGWTIVSAYFFYWRHKKLEEESYYV